MGIKLEDVDKNFKVESTLGLGDIEFYDVRKAPFKLYGADPSTFEGEEYWRMAKPVSDEIPHLFWHSKCSAGFRVRFKTNSEYVAVKVKIFSEPTVFEVRSRCCDLYVDFENGSRFAGRFTPPANEYKEYEAVIHFGNREERYFTLNLMNYEMLGDIKIGIQKDATVGEGRKYLDIKPILYYGSSITQGGCASRPGNTYQAIINRRNNIDYINLGFSGGAKAEIPVMEYIANRAMSIFVYDYDHNAPSLEYLRETHERGYKIVREKNPDLPIIFVTKPDFDNNMSAYWNWNENNVIRRTIVMQTYINAIESGDRNVYFVDGAHFFNVNEGDCCVADGCHPTDLGFMRMADVIGNQIDTVLSRRL